MQRQEREVTIKNKLGFHARPAALFVQTASKFDSVVYIRKNQETIDAKSIMNLLSLGLETGSQLTLIIEGEDADRAMEDLVKILESDG